MNKTIRVIKSMGVFAFFMLSMFIAKGQSKDGLLISKDVQRFANRNALAGDSLQRPATRARSTATTWIISKGVHARPAVFTPGNVKSEDIPVWTISKDVQRINWTAGE